MAKITGKKEIFEALQKFAESVTKKMTPPFQGEPEEQLRTPFETFMQEAGQALSKSIECKGETLLKGRLGKPDFGILESGLLACYVKLTFEHPGEYCAFGLPRAVNSGPNREEYSGNRPEERACSFSPGNDWPQIGSIDQNR